jgi:hypothetical protein
MTEERSAALEALCREATEGPWEVRIHGTGIRNDMPYAIVFDTARHMPVLERHNGGTVQDARFAAESRTALPEALAEVRRLRGVLTDINDGYCAEGRCDCKRQAFCALYTEEAPS